MYIYYLYDGNSEKKLYGKEKKSDIYIYKRERVRERYIGEIERVKYICIF